MVGIIFTFFVGIVIFWSWDCSSRHCWPTRLPDGQSHRYLTFINEIFNGNHSKIFQLGKQEYLIQLLSLIRLNFCNRFYTSFPCISEKINCFDVSVRSNVHVFARNFDFMYFKSSFVDELTFHFTFLLPICIQILNKFLESSWRYLDLHFLWNIIAFTKVVENHFFSSLCQMNSFVSICQCTKVWPRKLNLFERKKNIMNRV